jgi:hypothetical protein
MRHRECPLGGLAGGQSRRQRHAERQFVEVSVHNGKLLLFCCFLILLQR